MRKPSERFSSILSLRKQMYVERFQAHAKRSEFLCESAGIAIETLRTDQPMDQALVRFYRDNSDEAYSQPTLGGWLAMNFLSPLYAATALAIGSPSPSLG
jgi:hypothetical protein